MKNSHILLGHGKRFVHKKHLNMGIGNGAVKKQYIGEGYVKSKHNEKQLSLKSHSIKPLKFRL